jgi:hypothetical protein
LSEKLRADSFFTILLNLESETDIYTAWDRDFNEVIENYEHTKGKPPVTLYVDFWI